MKHKPVPYLVADHAEQQEGRQEGVEEQEVQCKSGQSAGVALVNDLVSMSGQTGSW